jgi:ELWxxDGT repeat protein
MALAYFSEKVDGHEQLWASDGTAAGTYLVKSFGAGPISDLTTVDGKAFFGVNDGVHGDELWTSDGTAAGTMLVDDIFTGRKGSFPMQITATQNGIYFTADSIGHGFELWRSNGTAAGTAMVRDINPGLSSSTPENLIVLGHTLYFTANDGATVSSSGSPMARRPEPSLSTTSIRATAATPRVTWSM